MKPEYIEGKRAQENFEEGMKSLFKVPKDEVVQAEKRKKQKRASRRARKQRADRD